ncbi:MAG: O-6-methylguanine DNA methyltransferase [Planctomycetota bacterium]
MELLKSRLVPSPLGPLLGVASAHGICGLFFDGETAQGSFEKWRRKHAPTARVEHADAHDPGLHGLEQQLGAYFAVERTRFALPLDLRGTDFQCDVWQELRRVPFGATVAYGDLGERMGRSGASRAIGMANGANPVPIIVPCHRVVSASGLGGFSGGIERKLFLLRHEGVLLPTDSQSLFN